MKLYVSRTCQFSWISTSMQKVSAFDLFIFEMQLILESHDRTGHTHFWPCPPEKFLSIFNLCEFVSTCKISAYFTDFFWSMVDWRILQSDWLTTFWHISQEQKFFQIWDLCRNSTNDINFHYKTNSRKINDQIFQ